MELSCTSIRAQWTIRAARSDQRYSSIIEDQQDWRRIQSSIDGGDHTHKVEAIATMHAYVAGQKIRIFGIPMVPTFKPNVLSHGRLKESGVDIRLDANPPYMIIERVKIILTSENHIYYFIAYPAQDNIDNNLGSIDTSAHQAQSVRDCAPSGVHEPSAVWALWASAPANPRFRDLQLERQEVEARIDDWACSTHEMTDTCSFETVSDITEDMSATVASLALRSSRPVPPALMIRNTDGTMSPRETPDMPRGMPATWLTIYQMFGHCYNGQMRATCANYNIPCPRKGDTKYIACDVIGIKSSPTYGVSRAGTAIQQAGRKLVWVMDISGPYPPAPNGAKYLLHAANNK